MRLGGLSREALTNWGAHHHSPPPHFVAAGTAQVKCSAVSFWKLLYSSVYCGSKFYCTFNVGNFNSARCKKSVMYSAVLKCTGRVNILGGALGEELYSCALKCCYCGCEIRCITVGKVQGVIQWVVGEVQYSGWGSG